LGALVVMGSIPAAARELTVAEQVAKVKVGRKIEVELGNGKIVLFS
jgi:hypothetical protein